MNSRNHAPVVFIHGLFQGFGHLRDLPFPSKRGALILDLLGYGERANMKPPSTMDAQVEHVVQELDRHEIPRATLVAHSVGGAVAMLLASAHPDRVDTVVNIEGNFTLADAFWSGKVARMTPEEADAMVAGFRNDIEGWLAGQKIAATPQQVAWARRMFDAQPASSVRALARAVVEATGRPDYLSRIEGVLDAGIPVHLMAGERSRAGWTVPEPFLRRAASMTIQRGVGHMMVLEDGEGFLALVASLV